MVDYTNKVHNIYGHMYYKATEKLSLFGSINYNKAEGGMEQVNMPDPEARLNGALEDFNFDFTNMNGYSDFSYSLIKLKAGFRYSLTEDLAFTADGLYADLTDDEGYVYGNESGSYYVIRSGFQLSF